MSKEYPLLYNQAYTAAAELLVDGYPSDYIRGIADIMAEVYGMAPAATYNAVRQATDRLQANNENVGIVNVIVAGFPPESAFSRDAILAKAQAVARLLRADGYLVKTTDRDTE